MASWKEINEAGGTVVLRVVCGLLAALIVFGLVSKVLSGGTISVGNAPTFIGGITLFGGYAVFGNRLRFR